MMHLIGRFLLALAFLGCADQVRRMDHPEDPEGQYSAQIQAARRLLGQKEDWVGRAECEQAGRRMGSGRVASGASPPKRSDALFALGLFCDPTRQSLRSRQLPPQRLELRRGLRWGADQKSRTSCLFPFSELARIFGCEVSQDLLRFIVTPILR